MSDTNSNGALPEHELRQRLPQDPAIPQQATSVESARQTVIDLNAVEERKDEKIKKTFGRTPDGTVFTVPQTHDMVSQLFSPTEPKNLSDAIVIAVLSVHLLALFLLPRAFSMPLFAVVFLFWRACYNGGIGYVLKEQSNYCSVVQWARRTGIFEKPESGKNKFPHFYGLLKREMETKIPKDYKFDEAPLEYNTWLLFRRGVDLILMCDFTSYCCFAIACGGTPEGEHLAMTATRWLIGIALFLFNLWVKLDAHRVVKDFAWYWGDFFFLMDQELTFDGVFEMAPHPMYSVGYAGFYGISLMAASYKVLFISIIGHAAQFAFLTFVENPHIEKTYNPPPPRKRLDDADADPMRPDAKEAEDATIDQLSPVLSAEKTLSQSYVRDIIGFDNLDLHRVIDNAALLLQFYVYTLALLTPSTSLYQTFFILNAVAWRLWYSLGIGYILDRQSRKKNWTRHFIKYGESTEEAWRQWKGIYHLSMTMCYVSFVTAAFKMYSIPPDWEYGFVLLRHVMGAALIALQLWTVFSIYESLGEFGWFFGDFFFDRESKLTYGGIYRFLNNPERVIGLAGVWGFALITWSKAIFLLALLSHVLTLFFIQFVEQPHMQKKYGQQLRQQSGVSKTFNRSLPESVRKWQGNVDSIVERYVDHVEEIIDTVVPKISAVMEKFFAEVKLVLRQYPSSVAVTRTASDMKGLRRADYSIEIEGQATAEGAAQEKMSGREAEMAQDASFRGNEQRPLMLEYGAPIRVRWTAPMDHSKKDWIGLYMLPDNTSREVTRVGSQGRWIATSPGAWESARAEQGQLVSDKQTIKWTDKQGAPMMTGEMEFAGDKLWWTTGVFEFRYHHDGKYNVMAISKAFEVRISRFDEEEAEVDSSGSPHPAVERALLPVVRNCFDRDPEIAPNSPDEAFGSLVEREGKFARRVVYAVWQMFGIEFSPSVVKADGNVRNLAWRILSAREVLAPYSNLSHSKGLMT